MKAMKYSTELLTRWFNIRGRLAACSHKDCYVCEENRLLIEETKQYLDKMVKESKNET